MYYRSKLFTTCCMYEHFKSVMCNVRLGVNECVTAIATKSLDRFKSKTKSMCTFAPRKQVTEIKQQKTLAK